MKNRADSRIFWLTTWLVLYTLNDMTKESNVWQQLTKDIQAVMCAVDAGLRWERMDPPTPESTALTADGPLHTAGTKFKVIAVHWVDGERSGYDGFATVLAPHFSIIHLPPETAKVIYEKAVNSLN